VPVSPNETNGRVCVCVKNRPKSVTYYLNGPLAAVARKQMQQNQGCQSKKNELAKFDF